METLLQNTKSDQALGFQGLICVDLGCYEDYRHKPDQAGQEGVGATGVRREDVSITNLLAQSETTPSDGVQQIAEGHDCVSSTTHVTCHPH